MTKLDREAYEMRAIARMREMSIAGRIEYVMQLLHGVPIVNECGCPTGERTAPLITKSQAAKLLDIPDLPETEPNT